MALHLGSGSYDVQLGNGPEGKGLNLNADYTNRSEKT